MRKHFLRALALMLCAAMVLTAVSCGKTEGPEETKGSGGEPFERPEAGTVTAYDQAKSDFALTVDVSKVEHDISPLLYGIFIEDINFAADGGLYAEMVQNRSFEFTKLAQGDEKHGWSDVGTIDAAVAVDDLAGCLNPNNTNYIVLTNASGEPAGIANRGFLDGMAVTEGAGYDFSVWAKGLEGFTGPLSVDITVNGASVAHGEIPAVTGEWAQYKLELTASATAHTGVKLEVTMGQGKAALDMVSLFPKDTFKGRENGLRRDLAEKLEALEPKFLRFPGGCVIEGVNLDAAYSWKDSIGADENGEPFLWNGTYGDVAARSQGQNIWTNENTSSDQYPSFMSYGLGFYEYFLLAEDIGAVGVPVLNCGLCCMGQSNGAGPDLDTPEFQRYIQDALDLVEFCRGDETTKWGAVRAAMGHPEPFELKYVGIGNEQWGSNYFRHYEAFVDAFAQARAERPEIFDGIEIMFSAGVDDGDSGYGMYIGAYERLEMWLEANPGKTAADYTGAIDHHYYNTPEWFFNHTDYYDEENYSRTDPTGGTYGGAMPVFLGEYAAQSNTWKAALSEAAYMTGLERNGDIVVMAAYAPLFGNLTAMHWAPDLIWFNNHQVTCSVNYYVQQAFANNAGTALLSSALTGGEEAKAPELSGMVGLGTWATAATFDNVKVVSNGTGETLAEDDFSSDSGSWQKVSDGDWTVRDGQMVQSNTRTDTNRYATTGAAVYFGDTAWKDYTFTVDAVKTAGDEGFLIPFAVESAGENFFWNIGGWGNTVSCLQRVSGGSKSDQLGGTVKNCRIETGKTYHLKVTVAGDNVKCYIDDELYVDYTVTPMTSSDVYEVVSTDETGDVIVKLVNVAGEARTVAVDLQNAASVAPTAARTVVAGTSLQNDNILGQPEVVTLKEDTLEGVTGRFNYTLPAYSVTILRIGK